MGRRPGFGTMRDLAGDLSCVLGNQLHYPRRLAVCTKLRALARHVPQTCFIRVVMLLRVEHLCSECHMVHAASKDSPTTRFQESSQARCPLRGVRSLCNQYDILMICDEAARAVLI